MNVADFIPEMHYAIDDQSIADFISGKTVLITGAAGSIGSAVAHKLANYQPGKLLFIDTAETPLHHLGLQVSGLGIPYGSYLTDVRNYKGIASIFKRESPEIVIHTAAYKHVGLTEDNPAEAIAVNSLGTQHLCDIAMANGIEHFVFISTDKAVNPISVLGTTKYLAELYVLECCGKQQETTFSIIRFGNVFNSNGSVIETFTNQLLEGKPVTITDRRAERYFISIEAVSGLILQSILVSSKSRLFTFEMGTPVKIEDLIYKLADYLQTPPVAVIETGLRPGEKLTEELYASAALISPTGHPQIMAIVEDTGNLDVLAVFDYLKELADYEYSPSVIKQALQNVLNNELKL